MNDLLQSKAHELRVEVKKASVWFIVLGVILILGGIAAVARPLHAGVALTLIVGWVLVANGVMAGVSALMARDAGGFLWRLFTGVFYIAGGILILRNPGVGLVSLTMVLGGMLILGGVARLFFSFTLSGIPGVGVIIFGAIMSMVIGVLVLAKLPEASEFVVGTLIGLDLISSGISTLIFGSGARRLGGALEAAE